MIRSAHFHFNTFLISKPTSPLRPETSTRYQATLPTGCLLASPPIVGRSTHWQIRFLYLCLNLTCHHHRNYIQCQIRGSICQLMATQTTAILPRRDKRHLTMYFTGQHNWWIFCRFTDCCWWYLLLVARRGRGAKVQPISCKLPLIEAHQKGR